MKASYERKKVKYCNSFYIDDTLKGSHFGHTGLKETLLKLMQSASASTFNVSARKFRSPTARLPLWCYADLLVLKQLRGREKAHLEVPVQNRSCFPLEGVLGAKVYFQGLLDVTCE